LAPVIGVTANLREDPESDEQRPLGHVVRADFDYVDGVVGAGGIPVVLPPIVETVEGVAARIDGLLLSGGSDLDPSYYGEEPVPELGVTIPKRDAFELALVRRALERGVPVFGICRGLQIFRASFTPI
jgi:putative glutamine amidotransferase